MTSLGYKSVQEVDSKPDLIFIMNLGTQHMQTVEWYEIGLPRYTTINVCQENKNTTVMPKWAYLLYMAYPSSSVASIIRKKFKTRNSAKEIDVKPLGFVSTS